MSEIKPEGTASIACVWPDNVRIPLSFSNQHHPVQKSLKICHQKVMLTGGLGIQRLLHAMVPGSSRRLKSRRQSRPGRARTFDQSLKDRENFLEALVERKTQSHQSRRKLP